MSVMNEYRVGYVSATGKKKAFRFKSDKSFRFYGRSYSQGILGLGNPFVSDMLEEGKKHDSFEWSRIKFIECIDTGIVKYY